MNGAHAILRPLTFRVSWPAGRVGSGYVFLSRYVLLACSSLFLQGRSTSKVHPTFSKVFWRKRICVNGRTLLENLQNLASLLCISFSCLHHPISPPKARVAAKLSEWTRKPSIYWGVGAVGKETKTSTCYSLPDKSQSYRAKSSLVDMIVLGSKGISYLPPAWNSC